MGRFAPGLILIRALTPVAGTPLVTPGPWCLTAHTAGPCINTSLCFSPLRRSFSMTSQLATEPWHPAWWLHSPLPCPSAHCLLPVFIWTKSSIISLPSQLTWPLTTSYMQEPYNGPEAPPTVDTRVRMCVLKYLAFQTRKLSFPHCPEPLAMLIPIRCPRLVSS